MTASAHSTDSSPVGPLAVQPGIPRYPQRLADLSAPPGTLWALGDLRLPERRCVAVIGTRTSTPRGRRITAEIAAALAERGVVVVSGLAAGIDTAAHQATLAAGGGTIAVIGTGVDRVYPPANRRLQARIAEDGLVISQLPPGAGPSKAAFPARNRLLVALSDMVVVVEAGMTGGTHHAIGEAIGLGRRVIATDHAVDGSPRLARLARTPAIQVAASLATLLDLIGALRTAESR